LESGDRILLRWHIGLLKRSYEHLLRLDPRYARTPTCLAVEGAIGVGEKRDNAAGPDSIDKRRRGRRSRQFALGLEVMFEYGRIEVNSRLCRVEEGIFLFLQGQPQSGDAPGSKAGFVLGVRSCGWGNRIVP
jgi:hypothetical protein